jgi:hypothetical protein
MHLISLNPNNNSKPNKALAENGWLLNNNKSDYLSLNLFLQETLKFKDRQNLSRNKNILSKNRRALIMKKNNN